MIITTESKDLYQQFKFINLNDKSIRLDTSIVKMISNDFDENQKLYLDVLRFLNENREEIIEKIDRKKEYQEIVENFNIVSSAIDLVHLNQIVNDFGQERLRNCVIN
jgi:DNA replication initiation complex subunit (GINS family)